MDIAHWFRIAKKREMADLIEPSWPSLELGAGSHPVDLKADLLDWPEWKAPDPIPAPDGLYRTIWAHHFMEHLSGADAIAVLREMERTLRPYGTANIVVPYYSAQNQAQDLDHKSVWCEETWRNLFNNPHYSKGREGGWKLEVHCCFILGIVERNISLFTQLKRKP